MLYKYCIFFIQKLEILNGTGNAVGVLNCNNSNTNDHQSLFAMQNFNTAANEYFFKVVLIGAPRSALDSTTKSATNDQQTSITILVSQHSVGKTSILERFVTDIYTEEYKATIGADFRTKELNVNGETVLLQIWDTGNLCNEYGFITILSYGYTLYAAGQERFRSLAAPFYRGAQICVLVFDVNEKHTFDAVEQWRDEFLHHADIEEQGTLDTVRCTEYVSLCFL